jgi:hypothetical protein
MNRIPNAALVKLAVAALYESGPMQKTAEARYLYRLAPRDEELLGEHFCKMAWAMNVSPWDMAFRIPEELAKIATQVQSQDPNMRKVAQFYMDWASYMEKQSGLLSAGKKVVSALTPSSVKMNRAIKAIDAPVATAAKAPAAAAAPVKGGFKDKMKNLGYGTLGAGALGAGGYGMYGAMDTGPSMAYPQGY